MNQFTIPTILVAIIIIAGVFAFVPVEKASTVHGNIQSLVDGGSLIEAGTITTDMFSNNLSTNSITITSTGDFVVFCQIVNAPASATSFTITDSGNAGATNTFDIDSDQNLAIQWAADADDTVTLSGVTSIDALCTAMTTTDGEITFG